MQKSLRVLGIHLGGAHNRKTALTRGFFSLTQAYSGLPSGPAHDTLARALEPVLRGISLVAGDQNDAEGVSPLIVDNMCPDVGPQLRTDGDSRLIDLVGDLGGADVIALDAALTLPPCAFCDPAGCQGFLACTRPEVIAMRREWEAAREKSSKKMRMPLPYLDRYFEIHARLNFEHPSFSGSFEFESIQGSGRAPLTARARHILMRLRASFPETLVVEVNSAAAALGWTLASGYRPRTASELRQELENRGTRAHVLKRLETAHFLARAGSLDESLFLEIAQRPELFLAAMSALSVRGLFAGDIYIHPQFLQLEPEAPLLGWALLPRDIVEYGWQH